MCRVAIDSFIQRLGRSKSYTSQIGNLRRLLKLYQLKRGLWIVANEGLSFGCDLEFTRKAAWLLYDKIKIFRPECLLTPETKAISLTYELAKNLNHKRFAIARKELKENKGGSLKICFSSITGGKRQNLVLSGFFRRMIQKKRVVIVDDCISTGETIEALLKLAKRAEAEVVALACIWLEGPWPWRRFYHQIVSGKLIYLEAIPIFAEARLYYKIKKRWQSYLSCNSPMR